MELKMIEINIMVGEDGPYYPSKVTNVPSVGDNIELTSYTDMASKLPHVINLKVNKVVHELVEFKEGHNIVKEHSHFVKVICSKA